MKSWWQSKTIWLGVAAVIGAACTAYAEGADWHAGLLAAVGAIGVWLRTKTSEPIGK